MKGMGHPQGGEMVQNGGIGNFVSWTRSKTSTGQDSICVGEAEMAIIRFAYMSLGLILKPSILFQESL